MRNLNGGTVVGFLALFVALSGASYAAIALPKNSVTTRQVKDRSLLARDFKRGQVPRGARGPQGPLGPQGVQGAQGPPGPVVLGQLTRVVATGSIAPGVIDTVTATCPGGMHVVSGGSSGGAADTFFSDSFGASNSWSAGFDDFNGSITATVFTAAYCAPAGQAVAARNLPNLRLENNLNALRNARLRAVLHRSGCHSAHTCPSDHGTYRWRGLRCWKAGADDRPTSARKRVVYQGRTYYCTR